MRILDLGDIDGPMILFGGPYSNSHALLALMMRAADMGVDAGAMICTGDIVADCADPMGSVAAIRNAEIPVIAGNCEKQLAAGAMDCGCGFTDGSACDVLSAGWFGFADRHVTARARAWMADLPDVVTFRHAGQRYAVIHGGLTDISRFIWSVSDIDVFEHEIKAIEGDVGAIDRIVAGHSGIAFDRMIGRHRWINAGVIGMPPNAGNATTQYVTLVDGVVSICDLTYDVSGAVAAMENTGLVQGYHTALQTGIWPSQDVLPPVLRR
jgi:predicted phosphodiesterase